jgi:hypothetical protein
MGNMEECFIAQPRLTAEFVIGAECVVADPPLPATVCGQPLIREPYVLGTQTSKHSNKARLVSALPNLLTKSNTLKLLKDVPFSSA